MNTRYSMVIQWSEDDQAFVVSLPEFGPYSKTHGAKYKEAVRNGQDVLESLIATYTADKRPLPTPSLWADERALAS